MRNPARLAAELSGRPMLMRDSAVAPLARALMLAEGEAGRVRTPFARMLGQAKRLVASRDVAPAHVEGPSAYAPRWLGEPEAIGFGWSLHDGIACLEIDGPLMAEGFGWGDVWYHGYDTLIRAYEEMFADARVMAVFEVLRSPGGVVDSGLPELAALKRSNRAAAGGKPIWSFCRAAYSAAYWDASSSDRVIASREGGVGSIGAVVTHCDLSGALENDGIRVTSFKFGARKTDGSPLEPLSETAEASFQAEIDQAGRWFVADVLAGRPNLTEQAVLETEAGCFYGDSDDPALSGLAHGLVDEIMTERAAFAALRALVAAETSPPQPSPDPDQGGEPVTQKETDMKRSAVMAALKRAGLKGAQLKRAEDELPEDEASEDDDNPAEDDENKPGAEDDENPSDAESDDEDREADSDQDDAEAEDDEDGQVDARTARAITDLPQAKGREKLAQTLALTPGMTVNRASRLLAAAPRGDGLAARMQGRDPRVSASGGKAPGASKPGDQLVAAGRARAEKAKTGRR